MSLINTKQSFNKEVDRATNFLVQQIRKGWTMQESFIQMRGSYGSLVSTKVLNNIKDCLL